jgi:hypothetical protein
MSKEIVVATKNLMDKLSGNFEFANKKIKEDPDLAFMLKKLAEYLDDNGLKENASHIHRGLMFGYFLREEVAKETARSKKLRV